MLFNSYTFVLFMLAVLAGHRLLPWRAGRWWLLIASYFFYACSTWYYIFLLFFCTLVTYLVGRALDHRTDSPMRRALLVAGVGVPLAVLGTFKYTGFIISQINVLLGLEQGSAGAVNAVDLVLPVGISFYAFQSIGYVVDVYRRNMEAVSNFGHYALYISFFPQLVAGPIERAKNIIPQLASKHTPTAEDTAEGMNRFLRGLFKKVVLADRLGLYVNHIYASAAGAHDGAVWWLATVCFAFQIYLDFSAYTDMALGCGRLLGIRLMENFRFPYLTTNPRDFWRRWHISLSSWLRDYLYIPLGGNRVAKVRQYLNVMIVMFLAGLWHGAAWHFVAWGMFMGLIIVIYDLLRMARSVERDQPLVSGPLGAVGGAVLTFGLVCIGWVFFRAASIADAAAILGRMFTAASDWGALLSGTNLFFVLMCLVLMLTHIAGNYRPWQHYHGPTPALARGLFWALMILATLYGAVEGTEEFIYFEF